jgi:transcriptional regulator with XRE-family HTH domain
MGWRQLVDIGWTIPREGHAVNYLLGNGDAVRTQLGSANHQMATMSSGVGPLLRDWRRRRRRTQFDLALDAGISARHLSFVETGRSKPSSGMVLLLAEHLGVPFRERNLLLLAAGHAPAFPERSLDDPELAPVQAGLDLILTAHEPYPAIAFDRAWNLVSANSAVGVLTHGVDSALLAPPANVMRISLHPRGMAPRIINLGEVRAHSLDRLRRQLATTGDDQLAALIEEITRYPAPAPPPSPSPRTMLGPIRLRGPEGVELSFFGMFATFDTPFDVTTSELAIEFVFPADPVTAAALEDPYRK